MTGLASCGITGFNDGFQGLRNSTCVCFVHLHLHSICIHGGEFGSILRLSRVRPNETTLFLKSSSGYDSGVDWC